MRSVSRRIPSLCFNILSIEPRVGIAQSASTRVASPFSSSSWLPYTCPFSSLPAPIDDSPDEQDIKSNEPKPSSKQSRSSRPPPRPIQSLYDFLPSISDLPVGLEMTVNPSTTTEQQYAEFHAFKKAEKHYQLHKEQIFQNVRGKMKLRGMRIAATDFSKVIDFTDTTTLAGHDYETVHLDALRCPAFHLKAHPGLYFLPALLSPKDQVDLARAFLDQLCEPPARSNHFLAHGYFEGLWRAYQESLTAVATACNDKDAAAPAPSAPIEKSPPKSAVQPPQVDASGARIITSRAAASGRDKNTAYLREGALRLSDDCRNRRPGASQGPYASSSSNPTTSDPTSAASSAATKPRGGGPSTPEPRESGRPVGPAASDSSLHDGASTSASSPTPDPNTTVVPYDKAWTRHGTGPSAEKVLKKMRWVTLGPQFDWDRRVYDPSLPHRPVPRHLLELSESVCDHVREAWEGRNGRGSSGLPEAGVYKPDVALVNVYREGDTLNGHKDDVEKDMSLPIVTVSLGCEAIFLVGGETKEIEPIAMYVRSGDVIIMGGDARRCFHGVPRILPENGVPDWLNPLTCEPNFRPYAEYFSTARINVSVRSTAEPRPERLREDS